MNDQEPKIIELHHPAPPKESGWGTIFLGLMALCFCYNVVTDEIRRQPPAPAVVSAPQKKQPKERAPIAFFMRVKGKVWHQDVFVHAAWDEKQQMWNASFAASDVRPGYRRTSLQELVEPVGHHRTWRLWLLGIRGEPVEEVTIGLQPFGEGPPQQPEKSQAPPDA